MTKAKLRTFRQQLQALGQGFANDVGNLTDEVFDDTGVESPTNLSEVPAEYPTDRGSNTYDEELAISLIEQEGPRQGEIKAALDKIDDGTFGSCEHCGREIALMRLEAIPFARLCIACARKAQRAIPRLFSDGDDRGAGARPRGQRNAAPLGRKVRDRVLGPVED
jgi:DnaK suppressor protein